MGVISPTQNSSALFENKLVFSGSQLATVVADDNTRKYAPYQENYADAHKNSSKGKSAPKQQSNKKQPLPAHAHKVPSRLQPATGESLEVSQLGSELGKQDLGKQMAMTQQLSGLFQQINANKVTVEKSTRQGKAGLPPDVALINPALITSPNNVAHNAVISQFSSGPMSMLQSPQTQVKQTP